MNKLVAKIILLLGLLFTASASAQTVPPIKTAIDGRGVDVLSSQYYPASILISIGVRGAGGMTYAYDYTTYTGAFNGRVDTFSSSDAGNPRHFRVTIGKRASNFNLETFGDNGADFLLNDIDGFGCHLRREFIGNAYVYTFHDRDGAVFQFLGSLLTTFTARPTNPYSTGGTVAYWKGTTAPSGLSETAYYKTIATGTASGKTTYISRVQSVTNNAGYQRKFEYQSNTYVPNDPNVNWLNVSKVILLNNAVEYCDLAADSCGTLVNNWPSFSIVGNSTVYPFNVTVTDHLGRVYTYSVTWQPFPSKIIGYTVTSPQGRQVTLTRSTYGPDTATWSDGKSRVQYLFSTSGDVRTTTITPQDVSTGAALYAPRTIVGKLSTRNITSDTDALGRQTTFAYDTFKRLTQIGLPDGAYQRFTYDPRGNVTESRRVAGSSSSLPEIVQTAAYDATCVIPAKCNQPNYTVDARGMRSDYSYASHGGMTSILKPAPYLGAVRPEVRYSYTPIYSWVKNSAGLFVQSATSIYKVSGTSSCTIAASCDGTSGEVETSLAFEIGSSSAGSNGLPITSASGAGDGSLTATVASTFDIFGNVLTTDGPLAGSADTLRYRYSSARQIIGLVGPDPDGSGPLKRRAVRTTYNLDGQVTLIERGTVEGLSDADWAAFASLEQTASAFDSAGRAIKSWLSVGTTTYAVAQTSYDAAGRPECLAQRMNPAVYGSLPASACSLGTTGANGPDRITKTVYDAADQALQTITAYGTSVQATETTSTYTLNGELATLADANSNLTTYEYDGFGRLTKARYPNASGGGSSTTDYEAYTYDGSGNTLTYRRRDGQVITYTYDNLNRIATQDAPSTSWNYDNLDRITTVSAGLNTSTWVYDALSRATAKTDAFGAWGYQYDLAGRRTRITYPDSYYATYSYDVTGAPTAIGEAGGTLVTYYYDNLGRRTGIARANGVSTTYGFDPVSRLTSLTHDLSGTTNDVTKGFTYSPASQILQKSVDNSAYIWTAATLAGTWTLNGLNQAISFNSTSLTYDARGNMTSDGTATYSYDMANRLTGKTEGPTLSYDAAGRLLQVAGSSTTRFAYDGGQIIAEYDGTGAMLRRYIPGAGVDETVVWYEGSAFTDRRFLIADERGSVISVTNNSGASIATNTYDEYGAPASGNTGRFQYTGQAYIAELGLYYYKARFYSPAHRRFLQPDPIGYGGGMAIYAYASGDPTNLSDPTGNDPGERGIDSCGVSCREALAHGSVWMYITREWTRTTYTQFGWVLTGFEDGPSTYTVHFSEDGAWSIPNPSQLPFMPFGGPLGDFLYGDLIAAVNERDVGLVAVEIAMIALPELRPLKLARAAKGFGNIGSHGAIDAGLALKSGEKWLGKGYTEIAPGVFRSSDNLRQFRMTTSDLTATHGKIGPHVHFEALDAFQQVIENLHLPVRP